MTFIVTFNLLPGQYLQFITTSWKLAHGTPVDSTFSVYSSLQQSSFLVSSQDCDLLAKKGTTLVAFQFPHHGVVTSPSPQYLPGQPVRLSRALQDVQMLPYLTYRILARITHRITRSKIVPNYCPKDPSRVFVMLSGIDSSCQWYQPHTKSPVKILGNRRTSDRSLTICTAQCGLAPFRYLTCIHLKLAMGTSHLGIHNWPQKG